MPGQDPVHGRRMHVQDPGDAALIEDMDGMPTASEVGDDIRLEVGEGEDEIWLEL